MNRPLSAIRRVISIADREPPASLRTDLAASLMVRSGICLCEKVFRAKLALSERFMTEGAEQRVQNRGCRTKGAEQRVQNRGCNIEGAEYRVHNRVG